MAQGPVGASGLSASSIDVLGTLLSVAAAATAASLLTGSSEPVFSSGLAPPSTHTSQQPHPQSTPISAGNSNPNVPTERPLSPTPTSDAGRMRHVWSSLRDRLGLGGHNNSGNPSSGTGTGRTRSRDAREVMLAEMARAFNLGLGLGSGQSPAVPTNNQTTQSHGEGGDANGTEFAVPAPPPDSFERFLMDLQTDLRVALTQEHELGTEERRHRGLSGSHNHDQGDAEDQVEDEAGDEENESMPDLRSLSDSDSSESESSHEEFTSAVSTPGKAARHAAQEPRVSGAVDAGSQLPLDEELEGQMPTRGAEAARDLCTEAVLGVGHECESPDDVVAVSTASSHSPSNAGSDPAPGLSSFVNSAPPAPSSVAIPSASTGEASTAPVSTPPSNVVVPVIVVGLQSVNMDRQPSQTHPEHEHHYAHPMDAGGEGPGLDGLGHDMPAPPLHFPEQPELPDVPNQQSRGRTWPSRAVNAIRNLRPTRRGGATANPQPLETPGSRTFLIYVIGGTVGYYPPEHQIITGGNLDSFEALWYLAELLGQVKPPTVSKEEIEKSGLEVIKGSSLEEYEKDGRVASNCVERCLICLDDYTPEEDLRVLSCRHVFHRGCVDRWLETGRNNCPACRSKVCTYNATPS
ncbi:hypothetical protein F5I97DRAFT_1810997 [Phlebopus sp. FC_14]|nr:hypothetical protein F5I97DRAFT_1810997 [Phlebopus sp. FC_14]